MSATANYQFLVALTGGPSVKSTGKLTPDAYTSIPFTLAPLAADVEIRVDLKVAAGGTPLNDMVVISADKYEGLSYRQAVADGPIPIDAPVTLLGSGAVGLLTAGAAVPSLFFSNSGTIAREVTILLSGDVTP
jgi:hypothetical protein